MSADGGAVNPPSHPPETRPRLQDTDPVAAAVSRLTASRAVLLGVLSPDAGAAQDGREGRARSPWRRWQRQLRRWPVVGLALQALRLRWQQHPLHAPLEALLDESRLQVVPLIRRHPVATVALAAMAGAGLMLLRPWRHAWLIDPVRHLPGQATRWMLQQLGEAPMQAALASLFMMATATSSPPAPEPPISDSPDRSIP